MSDALTSRAADAAMIERLRAELDAHAATIRDQATALAHARKIFERASAAARIGVWECTLPDERLTWTDMVYDIFDLPRGVPPDRRQILTCYEEDSVKALHALRAKAIAERGGFSLDAEITTLKGRRRWIRITATVECEDGVPVRIFGMKQDITEEKKVWDRTRYLAEFDGMTGLANRIQFQSRLAELERPGHAIGALLLVDLDGFKQVNDSFGHAVGDECLKQAAARLKAVCGDADLVARFGGDEFAVLLGRQLNYGAVAELAGRIVLAMRQPVEVDGRALAFGASVGIGRADGCTAADLFGRADLALYAAKAAGRNTFRTFKPGMIARQPALRRSA